MLKNFLSEIKDVIIGEMMKNCTLKKKYKIQQIELNWYDNNHEYHNLFADHIRKENSLGGNTRDVHDADNSVVSKSRPVPPTRSERDTVGT